MNQEEFEQIYQNRLTPRQKQVLPLVLAGKNNQQIAQIIKINHSSGISHHVTNIAQKFGITHDYQAYLVELFAQYRPELVDARLRSQYGLTNVKDYYQVGGTLATNCLSYVERECDRQLFAALLESNYCLVLNARQTGKSSLKIRTIAKLKSRNIKCVAVDITCLGSNEVQESRTKGFIAELFSQLDIILDVDKWWKENQYLTLMQRLNKSISLVLENISDKIIVFIDEIDSIPNADDFFALIRACYNQKAENLDYKRLTFCLLGTVSPNDLMKNKQRTPFNIGIAIDLPGFTLSQAKQSLLPGLSRNLDFPEATLKVILSWTKGQPFLTQKLCQLVSKNVTNRQVDVAQIVNDYMIYDWQRKDSPQHLRTISDRLISNPHKNQILKLYSQILINHKNNQEVENIDHYAVRQLLLSGLLIAKNETLQIQNKIYEQVFNSQWLNTQVMWEQPAFAVSKNA